MTDVIERDVAYVHGTTTMDGLLLSEADRVARPTVVLIHDAFGLGGFSLDEARRYAGLGYTVFAADVWGDRATLSDPADIGPRIGAMVGDRQEWIARIAAAHDAARVQPEVDTERIVTIGYCFGGASALEYARTGGRVQGVVAIHPGLDLLEAGAPWSPYPTASVLVCAGADDPMATPAQNAALQADLDAAAVPWELNLYSDTTHAFTNPRMADSPQPGLFAYQAYSAVRAQHATTRFLADRLHPKEHP